MQAIILAAGRGSRLAPHHNGPKSLIKLGETTILEESIACLHRNGVQDIILVTGFEARKFDPLIRKFGLQAVLNKDFEIAGTLHSLMLAESLVKEDVIIFEADVIYECRAITSLINDAPPNTALLSGPSGNGDELYAYVQNARLAVLSKARLAHLQCAGEFVGITKVSHLFIRRLFECCAPEQMSMTGYETCGLMTVSKDIPLRHHLIPGLIWTEIDDLEQLARAKSTIYPALKRNRKVVESGVNQV